MVVRWLDIRQVLFCATLGGENCSVAQAARRKKAGYRRGVPDLIIYDFPPKVVGKVGFAIEMKPTGSYSKGTPEQQMWLKRLAANGWLVGVFKGADQAIYALEQAGY